jgi:hypothetical protein
MSVPAAAKILDTNKDAARNIIGNTAEFIDTCQAWDVIDTTCASLCQWNGTFVYNGTPLYEGRVLTKVHDEIEGIVRDIRKNHKEFALSPKSRLDHETNHIRLVCAQARDGDDSDGLERERKTRTTRAAQKEQQCPAVLNIVWRNGAWKVGKLVVGHQKHFARQHQEHKVSNEQRERIGASMVDANLSAAQVALLSLRFSISPHAFLK